MLFCTRTRGLKWELWGVFHTTWMNMHFVLQKHFGHDKALALSVPSDTHAQRFAPRTPASWQARLTASCRLISTLIQGRQRRKRERGEREREGKRNAHRSLSIERNRQPNNHQSQVPDPTTPLHRQSPSILQSSPERSAAMGERRAPQSSDGIRNVWNNTHTHTTATTNKNKPTV